MSSIPVGRRLLWCAAGAAACLMSAQVTRAEDTDPHAADALFEQGKALLDAERVNEACERLQDSMRLDPAIGTLGLLAWCHERQGRKATAWREYLEVADMAAKANAPDREKVARQRAAELQRTISTLRIEVQGAVPGLQVLMDNGPLTPESWGKAMPLDPGQVTLSARAPGYIPWRTTVEIGAEASSVVVRVPLLELPAPPPPPPVVVRKPTPIREAESRSVAPPLIAYAVGGTGLLVGTIYGLRTIKKNDDSDAHCDAQNHCDAEGGALRDDARRSGTISTIGFGVGVAGAVVGTWLVLSSPDNGRAPARATVAPAVAPGNLGLSVAGRFW